MFLCLYKNPWKSLFVEYIDIKIFRISSLFLKVLISLTKWLVGFSCGFYSVFFRTKTVTFNTQLIQKVFQFLFFLLYVVECYFYAQNLVSHYTKWGILLCLLWRFFKCPLYTYIEVKLKICYYGGFSKIPYFNNKRGVSIYMGIWEW